MRTRILGAALSLLAVGAITLATAAHAQVATTYSSNKRTLKVGILLLDSTIDADLDGNISAAEAARGPENPDPFVFHIADARADIKPQNWEFINPLSPKVVTNDVAARWAARTGGSGEQYQAGQQVTKNMAAYWEVPLTDTPIQDLLQFDLLFITNHRITRLTAADREKLRKLVDAGGVLWIEDCGGMRMDPTGPLFLDQLQFSGGRGEATTGPAFPSINIPTHPILNTPNPLSQAEIANLGDKNYSNFALVSLANPAAAPNPEVLVNIVGNQARGGLPYIAAGAYGSGRVIATAGDSGCDINDYAGGIRTPSGGNSGAFCGENLITAHAEDLKFLYNIVAWGSANSQYRKDPRRTGASFESVGAPLVPAFQVALPDALSSITAPVVAKGVVYATGLDASNPGVASVRAYNAHPSLVAGDKGIPDLSLGKSHDELWRWNGAGGIPSAPTLGTVYDPVSGSYGDFIFVTLGNGNLVKLTALLADGFGNISPAPGAAANAPVASGVYALPGGVPMPAPAPILHDGKVYVVEADGLVRCVDAATMQTLWYSYAVAQDPIYHPTGSPTLGYTRLAITVNNNRTGVAASAGGNSNDLMLYVPTWQENPNGGFTFSTMSYWLGARHEVVTEDRAPGSGDFATRAAQNAPTNSKQYVARTPGMLNNPGIPFQLARVRVYTNTYVGGNLVFSAQDNMNAGRVSTVFIGQFIDQNGVIHVRDGMGNPPTRGVPGPGSTPDNAIVSADYDVYYVTPGVTPPALAMQGNASRNRLAVNGYINGGEGVALTVDDILVSAFRYVGQTNSGTPQPHTAISGDYEQYGLTRLRQSLGILEVPGGLQGVPVTIQNQNLVERPTFRNSLQFSGGLSQTGAALHLLSGGGRTYEGLVNIEPVGTPVATNDGIVYQALRASSLSNGGTVTVIAALDMKKEVVLRLPKAYNPSYRVQISQLNLSTFDPSNTNPAPVVSTILPQAPNGSTVSVTQNLVGDATRGRIVMTDLKAQGGRFSTALSFVVTFVPAGGTADEIAVITPTPLLPNNGPGTDVDERSLPVNGSYSPLLWYYVLPGNPTSSLTLAGDVLFMGITSGGRENLVALDAEPTSNDPSIQAGQQVEAVVSTLDGAAQKLNHVRWVRTMPGTVIGAPVGAQGTLAINTAQGTEAFESGVTLVTDAKRIIEVDAAGAALWTLDGTMSFLVAGGELPVFDPGAVGGIVNPTTATGRAVVTKKTLSRPSLARRLSPSDYLICDTGNNRVVRVDRSGQVRWELTQLNDIFGVLGSVDPTTLSAPMDVQLYTVLSPANAGYEIHYLIADAGNSRIVEVVDYFDPQGNVRTIATPNGPQRGEQVVVWVSRTTQKEGRLLRFQSLRRVLTFGEARLGQDPTLYGYPTILAAVGNASAAGDSGGETRSDFTGGSLVSLTYNPINTTFPLFNAAGAMVTTYAPWPVGTEPARNGLVDRTMNELVMPTSGGQRPVRRIARPTYVEQFSLPNGMGGQKSVFLICDSSGVYQAELGTDNRWYVTWYFDATDYQSLMSVRLGAASGLGFLPSAAKRLANGDYLITNSWIGQSPLFASGQFVGEVFQVEGNRRFDSVSGNQLDPVLPQNWPVFNGFSAPNIVLTRNLMGVVIRRDQKMGSNSSNTNLLEHPLFGDRL